MNHSPELGELFAALAAAQAELPKVKKDKKANYGKYADLAACAEAAREVLPKNGIAWSQWGGHDDAGHDVLWTMLGHTSGQWIASDMLLHLVKDDPQGQGSAITYARRYGLCSAIGLVADDDDDGQAASKPKQQRSERPSQERRTPAPSSPPQARTEAPSGQTSPFQRAHAYASERGLTQEQWRDVLKKHRAVTAENLEDVMASVHEAAALGAPFSEGAA